MNWTRISSAAGARAVPARNGQDCQTTIQIVPGVSSFRPCCEPGRFELRKHAFTLIELLVVISIIGILAALIIGAFPAIKEKKIRARTHGELEQLVHLIESYKAEKNFYPPDVTKSPVFGHPNSGPLYPPLYYELLGTTNITGGYETLGLRDQITTAQVVSDWKIDGFANSGIKAQTFHTQLKPAQFKENSAGVRFLVAPYDGPPLPGEKTDFNPWRYVSSNPTNNTESFDLWAEISIGGKIINIHNWKD